MHELGVLRNIVKMVVQIAKQNHIKKVKHITLEVGRASGFVPAYLKKLFPLAVDQYPVLRKAELRILMVNNHNLIIKEIGY